MENKNKKDIGYWRSNAEEDYINTPISVLKYISELEKTRANKEDKTYNMWLQIIGVIIMFALFVLMAFISE